MGIYIIYFVLGFKSSEVARNDSRSGEWYEWTERGRNLIRRTIFNCKTIRWLCDTLKEASKVKGNSVKKLKIS